MSLIKQALGGSGAYQNLSEPLIGCPAQTDKRIIQQQDFGTNTLRFDRLDMIDSEKSGAVQSLKWQIGKELFPLP